MRFKLRRSAVKARLKPLSERCKRNTPTSFAAARQPRRADLGAGGIYYRALVGPFASAEKAAKLCSGLKAAGGNCVILKN